MTAAALAEWNRITHELAAKNVITTVDQAILALYCQAYAQWAYHSEQLEQEEHFLNTPKGYRYINPRIGLINTLGEKLAKYAAELGITPSSRSRIKVTAAPPAPRDKKRALAETLFGAKVAK
jgi:P27 family predicted phage terminase small subunit